MTRVKKRKVFMYCDELNRWYVMMVENCLARQLPVNGKTEARAKVRELRKIGYYRV